MEINTITVAGAEFAVEEAGLYCVHDAGSFRWYLNLKAGQGTFRGSPLVPSVVLNRIPILERGELPVALQGRALIWNFSYDNQEDYEPGVICLGDHFALLGGELRFRFVSASQVSLGGQAKSDYSEDQRLEIGFNAVADFYGIQVSGMDEALARQEISKVIRIDGWHFDPGSGQAFQPMLRPRMFERTLF